MSFIVRNPIYTSKEYVHLKDPCIVFDGTIWHIYGTGDKGEYKWVIVHLTSFSYEGPWEEAENVKISGDLKGGGVCAPSVVYDFEEKLFHMFIQTEYNKLGGKIEHLTSNDGKIFYLENTALTAIEDSEEACIYDPHPATVSGQKYLTYSGSREVGRPDIYLAKSVTNSWTGPWERNGKILTNEEVSIHNQFGDSEFEWGLEGSQILEIPNKGVLLNAVCFLRDKNRGEKQRIFIARAENIEGPYKVIKIAIEPDSEDWQSAENGHGSAVIKDGKLILFYQVRGLNEGWKYGVREIDIV